MVMMSETSERAQARDRRVQRVQQASSCTSSPRGKTESVSHRNYATTTTTTTSMPNRTTTCEHYFRLNNSCTHRLLPASASGRISLQESQSSSRRLDKLATRLKRRIDELAEDGSRRLTNHRTHYKHRHHSQQVSHKTTAAASPRVGSKMLRLIRWPLVHLCLPLCLTRLMFLTALVALIVGGSGDKTLLQPVECSSSSAGTSALAISANGTRQYKERNTDQLELNSPPTNSINQNRASSSSSSSSSSTTAAGREKALEGKELRRAHARLRRWSLLMPINELRVSGSKLEPPSRPSQDWSKQRPYFGSNIQRNISVELGKTAHLTCKVFELGDKTVSWLRPRENEILTAGKYTYIGDSRIGSMNEQGSPDWILEIKDVGLNDSASYECQVSTDPKMSMIINLNVQAARAKIKQGENNYYPVGATIEFSCEVLPPPPPSSHHNHNLARASSSTSSYYSMGSHSTSSGGNLGANNQQIYWYHNGNLINYAKASGELPAHARHIGKFAIDWDETSQTSKLKLANIQLADSGNYTCKPSSAEPATVRLFVKKPRIGGSSTNRVHYSGGANAQPKEAAQSTGNSRQHYGLDLLEVGSSSAFTTSPRLTPFSVFAVCLLLAVL